MFGGFELDRDDFITEDEFAEGDCARYEDDGTGLLEEPELAKTATTAFWTRGPRALTGGPLHFPTIGTWLLLGTIPRRPPSPHSRRDRAVSSPKDYPEIPSPAFTERLHPVMGRSYSQISVGSADSNWSPAAPGPYSAAQATGTKVGASARAAACRCASVRAARPAATRPIERQEEKPSPACILSCSSFVICSMLLFPVEVLGAGPRSARSAGGQ